MPQSKEYRAFTVLVDRLLAVPHSSLKKRIDKHRASVDANPKRRGPKRKDAMPSASRRDEDEP